MHFYGFLCKQMQTVFLAIVVKVWKRTCLVKLGKRLSSRRGCLPWKFDCGCRCTFGPKVTSIIYIYAYNCVRAHTYYIYIYVFFMVRPCSNERSDWIEFWIDLDYVDCILMYIAYSYIIHKYRHHSQSSHGSSMNSLQPFQISL